MVNLKNYTVLSKHFVLLLTFLVLFSCAEKKYFVSKIEGKKINISDKQSGVPEIESYIKPFRERIDADLSAVLAYNPENLEKSSGKWQTNIGNFLSDLILLKGNEVFLKQQQKTVDICVLNHGGIRSIIPKGNVTSRNAFEVMPFENAAFVVSLKGEDVIEIAKHIILEKKPHPLSGMTFEIDKNNLPQNILVNGKPIDNSKIYNVITSDYLSNGGDNMSYFKKGVQLYDLNYKLRNMMIDYFKDVDTLKINNDIRIKEIN